MHAALSRADATVEGAVMVGDTPYDLEAANRAGMVSIGLIGTTTREKLAKATLVVENLSEVSPDKVRELLRRHSERSVGNS